MTEMHYPLRWPQGQPRTERRHRSQFDTPLWRARNGLTDQLRMLGARNAVITTNLPLNRYGEPKATDQRKLTDPGVAVFFSRKDRDLCLAVDKWPTVEDNLHAIELAIAAIRGLERWGTSEMVDAAFTGFAALPSGAGGTSWWDVLGVPPDASWDTIGAVYIGLAKQHHPDLGGDPQEFQRITEAYRQAAEERAR